MPKGVDRRLQVLLDKQEPDPRARSWTIVARERGRWLALSGCEHYRSDVALVELAIAAMWSAAFVVPRVARYFNAENRLRRTLRSARVWPIGELPEGTLGRVIGEVQPLDRVLEGPLTGRPCVFYVARIEEHGAEDWFTIFEERNGVPFLLTDPSGRAIVDPACANLELTFDRESTSGTLEDPTPTQAAFLAKHGVKYRGLIFNKMLRYVEAVIEPGEHIAVLGSGIREPDPQATPPEGYRSAAPTRLRLTSSPRHPLVISDAPSMTDAAAPAAPPRG